MSGGLDRLACSPLAIISCLGFGRLFELQLPVITLTKLTRLGVEQQNNYTSIPGMGRDFCLVFTGPKPGVGPNQPLIYPVGYSGQDVKRLFHNEWR
jgi:hypothetical protein